jgi:hypothetical protein
MSVFIGGMGFVVFAVSDVERDYPGGVDAFSQRDDLPSDFCHDGRIGLWAIFMPSGSGDPGLEEMRAFGIDAAWPRIRTSEVAEGPLSGGVHAWLEGDEPGTLVVPRSWREESERRTDQGP